MEYLAPASIGKRVLNTILKLMNGTEGEEAKTWGLKAIESFEVMKTGGMLQNSDEPILARLKEHVASLGPVKNKSHPWVARLMSWFGRDKY